MKKIIRYAIGLSVVYFAINWIADNPLAVKVLRKKMNKAVEQGWEAAKEATEEASQSLDK
jgi:hypothetical protein